MTLRGAVLVDRLGDTWLEWVQERMGGGELKKVTFIFSKKKMKMGVAGEEIVFILNFDVGEITYL